MCQRLLDVKPAAIRTETPLTSADWITMQKIVDYLKPLADLKTMASAEHACISEVYLNSRELILSSHVPCGLLAIIDNMGVACGFI